jgi:hypothetical protein
MSALRPLLQLLEAEEGGLDGRAAEAAVLEEKQRLDDFLLQNRQRYDFPAIEHDALCRLLVARRFVAAGGGGPRRVRASDHWLGVMQALRVLLRDERHRAAFVELGGLDALGGALAAAAREHFRADGGGGGGGHGHGGRGHGGAAEGEAAGGWFGLGLEGGGEYTSELLVELLSIVKRFGDSDELARRASGGGGAGGGGGGGANGDGRPDGASDLHSSVALLLRSHEALVLQCALVALAQLVRLRPHREPLARLPVSGPLLRIIAEYEIGFKRLAAEALGWLVREGEFARGFVDGADGLPTLLSLLHADDGHLPLALLVVLDALAASALCCRELRELGGLQVRKAPREFGRSAGGAI